MLKIDKRLKEAESEMNLTENFNRLMGFVDNFEQRIAELETETSTPFLKSISFTRDATDTLELTPEFESGVFEYSAEAEATDWDLSVEAADETANIGVKLNDVEVTVDDVMSLTLDEGENVVEITVDNGGLRVGKYTVTITVTASAE